MHTKEPTGLYLQSPKMNQLNILREVSTNPNITQAELAGRCALSVAMVNNYMKGLCSEGLLEYRRKTTKSVTYHLTPSGAEHLEILQADLTNEMLRMFVAAKKHICDRISNQTCRELRRAVLFGTGHLAQLAFHALESAGTSIVGVCDDNPEMIGSDFCGREVLGPPQIRYLEPDAVVVAGRFRAEEVVQSIKHLEDHGIKIIRLDGCLLVGFMACSKQDSSESVLNRNNVNTRPSSVHGVGRNGI